MILTEKTAKIRVYSVFHHKDKQDHPRDAGRAASRLGDHYKEIKDAILYHHPHKHEK